MGGKGPDILQISPYRAQCWPREGAGLSRYTHINLYDKDDVGWRVQHNKICRATIKRQLLVKVDKANLPSLLKIAWNAAIRCFKRAIYYLDVTGSVEDHKMDVSKEKQEKFDRLMNNTNVSKQGTKDGTHFEPVII